MKQLPLTMLACPEIPNILQSAVKSAQLEILQTCADQTHHEAYCPIASVPGFHLVKQLTLHSWQLVRSICIICIICLKTSVYQACGLCTLTLHLTQIDTG